jgi:hypothetical protein
VILLAHASTDGGPRHSLHGKFVVVASADVPLNSPVMAMDLRTTYGRPKPDRRVALRTRCSVRRAAHAAAKESR